MGAMHMQRTSARKYEAGMSREKRDESGAKKMSLKDSDNNLPVTDAHRLNQDAFTYTR